MEGSRGKDLNISQICEQALKQAVQNEVFLRDLVGRAYTRMGLSLTYARVKDFFAHLTK